MKLVMDQEAGLIVVSVVVVRLLYAEDGVEEQVPTV